jgi:hypothetical protein
LTTPPTGSNVGVVSGRYPLEKGAIMAQVGNTVQVIATGETGTVVELTTWSGRPEVMVDLGSEEVGFSLGEIKVV